MPSLLAPPGCNGTRGGQYTASTVAELGMSLMQVKLVPQPPLKQACSVGNTARLLLLGTQAPSLRHSHFAPALALATKPTPVGALAGNNAGASQ